MPQNEFWDVVVVTGEGSSATSYTGVSTLYTLDGNTNKMTKRGTADRVCSGNTYYLIGYSGQGPGKIARAMAWSRVLSVDEIQEVANTLRGQHCVEGDGNHQFRFYLFVIFAAHLLVVYYLTQVHT